MDLSKIIKQAQQNAEQAKPIVHSMNDSCSCGHARESHEIDGNGDFGLCNQCDCLAYFPKAQEYDINARPEQPVEPEQLDDSPSKSLDRIDAIIAEGEASIQDVENPTANDSTEASPEITKISTTDITELGKDSCNHLCSKCNKWWTHGARDKCRFPDLLNQGLCFVCLNGATNPDPLDDFEEKDGKIKLTEQGVLTQKNKARTICKDMNIEQLTNHIQFIAKQIMELQARALESRKMRAELEDETLSKLPEEDRERFRQELRNGVAKKKREKAAKAEKAAPMSKMEKLINDMMKRTGKSREFCEKFLND